MFGFSRLRKRMLVRYAQAVASAQLLEHALTTMNYEIEVASGLIGEKRLDRLLAGPAVSGRTMGKTLKRIVASRPKLRSSDLYRDLGRLIDDRDLLIHR